MIDISTILNNETFTPEEQLEIIKYIDAQLEQMELISWTLSGSGFRKRLNRSKQRSTGYPNGSPTLTLYRTISDTAFIIYPY